MGDEVTNYRTEIKIPDEWTRKREEFTVSRLVLGTVIPVIFFAGLGLTALIIFLKNLKSPDSLAIPWRRLSRWALWGLGAYILIFALGNRITAFLGAYRTEMPFKVFVGTLAVGGILGGAFYFGFLVFILGAAWFFARRAFAEEYFPTWTGMPAPYYRDAFFIGIGGAGALVGLQTLIQAVAQHWPTPHREASASFGSNFDAYVPAGAILGTSLLHGLLYVGFVALAATFVASMLRPTWLKALVFAVATFATVSSNWGSPADYVKQWIAGTILLAVLVLGVRYVMRFNIFGCFLVVGVISLASGAAELLGQPDRFYRLNGYAVVAALVLLLTWPLLSWRSAPGGDNAAGIGGI